MTLIFDTFFIDTFFLCPIAGVFLVWLLAKLRLRRFLLLGALIIWLIFVLIAGAIYYDKSSMATLPLVGRWFAQFGSGNDFMWNFEWRLLFGKRLLDNIPTYMSPWSWPNIVAWLFFLIVYPLAIWFGTEVGKILFGRSHKQTGVIGLVPWFGGKNQDGVTL